MVLRSPSPSFNDEFIKDDIHNEGKAIRPRSPTQPPEMGRAQRKRQKKFESADIETSMKGSIPEVK